VGNLMNLAVYNPAILSDKDFLAGFVARHEVAENLLARLDEVEPDGLAAHHLILGQRGMGKTTLLRRLALGVRDNPKLASVLLPLSFREEQYNVHNLHVFWCNCLDALGDWFEQGGQQEKADAIDREVAALTSGGADPEGEAARELFRRWARAEKRRPLLLLDNIDLILNGLHKHDWSLRRALQEAGGVVLVGATSTYLEQTADREAAFYDFFQVTVLEPLSAEELMSCLRRLAESRGDPGKPVRQVLGSDPGRIRTLHTLTGGNPRTLVLLYLLLEAEAGGDVMRDLERLLDQVTVLYKARVEDLAPQARVVLDAVALNWDPIAAAGVAEITGLDVQAASSQLDRLVKAGILEKVSISTTSRTAFQLVERFFNTWYLMRHGPRRQRARLRWLTGFLRGFFSPSPLQERALGLLNGNRALHAEQAETAYRRAIALSERDAAPWNGLGCLLMDHLGRYEEAEQSFLEALDREPDYVLSSGNLLMLKLVQPGRVAETDATFAEVVSLYPPHGAVIVRALLSVAHLDLEEATARLERAFDDPHPEIFSDYWDDLLRVFRLAAQRGLGEGLLAWMDRRGISDRFWPLRAAYDAFLHGEERLMDVNPEVRTAARRIYDWWDSLRRHTGTSRPKPPQKRAARPKKRTKPR